MIPTIDDTDIHDPYPIPFDWPDNWSPEYPEWPQVACPGCQGSGCSPDMQATCKDCGGDGWIFEESSDRCCEDGFLPLSNGGAIACFNCQPETPAHGAMRTV